MVIFVRMIIDDDFFMDMNVICLKVLIEWNSGGAEKNQSQVKIFLRDYSKDKTKTKTKTKTKLKS